MFRLPDDEAPKILKGPVRESSKDDAVEEAHWTRIAHFLRTTTDPPRGRLYFVKRKNKNDPQETLGPRFFVVWRPEWVTFPTAAQAYQHGFHVFFHPSIHKNWHWTVDRYNDLPRRYMFTENFLVQQHYWTKRKVIFVMPVGSDVNQMGDLTAWTSLERLLREVLFFMLRAEGASALTTRLHTVGRVAVSGFSWGINSVTPILGGAGPRSARCTVSTA